MTIDCNTSLQGLKIERYMSAVALLVMADLYIIGIALQNHSNNQYKKALSYPSWIERGN